jgi:C-terminal processing protease CtpA/Prc
MKTCLLTALLPLATLPAFAQQPAFLPYTPAQAQAEARLWDNPTWHTPYRAQLSAEEKIAGLSRFWAEAKYSFPFFDKVPHLAWDSLYVAYIPKVQAAPSTLAYYQLLQEFCAQLRDGHTNVYPPQELLSEVYERPPLRTALLEGRVFITEVSSETLRRRGLVPGLEVVAVDGVPVHDYARPRAAAVSASTPQDRDLRAYSNLLLAGPATRPVELTLRDARGRSQQQSVARSGYTDVAPRRPPLEFRVLPGNVGYLALNGFDDARLPQLMAEVYPQLSQTRALVIDVRANGGGNSDYGYAVLSYLTDQPFPTNRWMLRAYRPAFRPWERAPEWYTEAEEPVKPHGGPAYAGPVAVLTGPRTFSAAEDFAVAFDGMKRGVLVGEPTGGSTGQPMSFSLPGGGTARICSKRDTYPDGREFVGVGVQPQVLVRPSVQDLRQGRDAVLEAALKELKARPKS